MNLRGISSLADPDLGYRNRDLTGDGIGHRKAILCRSGNASHITLYLNLV